MNYKFKSGDKVLIMSYVGWEDGYPATVYSAYTSDKENHPAEPHNRYVCYDDRTVSRVVFNLHDVCEGELIKPLDPSQTM